MTFAKEAWPFVLPFALVAVALAATGRWGWTAAAVVLALAVLLFFRSPARRFDGPASMVLAPADGKVLRVEEVEDPAVGPGRYRRVVTFLSVFDVHVQRAPVAGEVVVSQLTRGRKVAAFRGDAGEVNERHLTVIARRGDGAKIGIRQIAGLVARRVVCYLDSGDAVQRGELMGVIKFGSRVDLLVPASYRVLVEPGDRVAGGRTAMAEAPEDGS
jgi:phosphatidylserine decarboxylase